MQGPSDALRASVAEMLAEIRPIADDEAELRLEAILADIGGALGDDLTDGWEAPLNQPAALDLLAAVESWASVISSAVAWVYAPASPFPRAVAGWSKAVAKRLRWLTTLLARPVGAAAGALGATSWSVDLAHPWGVTISIVGR